MLVLTRKVGEQINIGDQITITVIEVQGQRMKLGIQAPDSFRILRAELPRQNDKPASDTSNDRRTKQRRLMEAAAERRRQTPLSERSASNMGDTRRAKIHADCDP